MPCHAVLAECAGLAGLGIMGPGACSAQLPEPALPRALVKSAPGGSWRKSTEAVDSFDSELLVGFRC